jgi:adenylosuccinate lyase
VTEGQAGNPLPGLLSEDERIGAYLSPERVLELLDASVYVGDAPQRARAMAEQMQMDIKTAGHSPIGIKLTGFDRNPK